MDDDAYRAGDKEPGTLILVIGGAAFALLLCLGAAGYFVFQTWAPPAPRSTAAPPVLPGQPGGLPVEQVKGSSGLMQPADSIPAETIALPGSLPGGKMPPHSDKIIRRVTTMKIAPLGELYSGGQREGFLSIEWSRLLPASHSVAVTEGSVLKFRADWDVDDLSALTKLKPGDLDAADLGRANLNASTLAPLAHLTGLRALRLEGLRIDDRAMETVRKLSSLEFLELRDCPITDDGIRTIAQLPKLKALSMRGAHVTGAGLTSLGRLRNLRDLEIVDSKLVDKDLPSLTALTGLFELRLRDSRITDEGLVWFKHLRSLRTLRLSDARIRGSGLVHLHGLPLQVLDLEDTYLDDAGAQNLVALNEVFRLFLDDTKVTDKTIPMLLQMPSLRHLNLAHTLVTDAGVLQLAQLKDLSMLNLPAHITKSTRAELQKKLPRCQIDQQENWPFD